MLARLRPTLKVLPTWWMARDTTLPRRDQGYNNGLSSFPISLPSWPKITCTRWKFHCLINLEREQRVQLSFLHCWTINIWWMSFVSSLKNFVQKYRMEDRKKEKMITAARREKCRRSPHCFSTLKISSLWAIWWNFCSSSSSSEECTTSTSNAVFESLLSPFAFKMSWA